MPLQVTVQNIDASGDTVFASGYLIPSGSYPGSAGDTIDFTNGGAGMPLSADFAGITPVLPSSGGPLNLSVFSQNGNLVRQYQVIKGTTQLNSKLVLGQTTFGSAQGAATYASLADVAGDTIQWVGQFKKLQ